MAIRQQVVCDCVRPVLLHSDSILNAHRTYVLEERQSAQTCTQRSTYLEIHCWCFLERKDVIHSRFRVATRPKQLHAQEVHQKVHEKAQRRVIFHQQKSFYLNKTLYNLFQKIIITVDLSKFSFPFDPVSLIGI